MQEVFEKIIEKLAKEKDLAWQFTDSEDNQTNARFYGKVDAFEKAIEIVKQADVEYNNGWIPCSERLPSDCENHEVTARLSNGKICREFAYYDKARGEWWNFDDDGLVNVIAWKEGSQLYQPNGE